MLTKRNWRSNYTRLWTFLCMHVCINSRADWFIKQTIHSSVGVGGGKRQEEYTFLKVNHILTTIDISLPQKWLWFKLQKRWRNQSYKGRTWVKRDYEKLFKIFFSIVRKEQRRKFAKRQVHISKKSLDNHKSKYSFKRFFSDDSHPTRAKQWGARVSL